MNYKKINYNGTDIEEIYKLALIGADFATGKNENGITVIDSLRKELYARTVLLARFLNIISIPEDRVMSLAQYKEYNYDVDSFGGDGIKRLKADYKVFISMLDDEIRNCFARENDVTNRFKETMAVDMSPEKLESLKTHGENLVSVINSITDAVKKAEVMQA